MTNAYDRVQARDAAIRALLPLVPECGWTNAALKRAAGPSADLLFPGGPPEMVEAYVDMADRDMEAASKPLIEGQSLTRRVRTLILLRFDQALPHKQAISRAMVILARPANIALAMRCTAHTVDAIWSAAGDTSADFSWYTKRAILASVYSSTLLYWMKQHVSRDQVEAFLDRRLAGVAQLGKLRARLEARLVA